MKQLTDRRKPENTYVRNLINRTEQLIERSLRGKCRICGKTVLMPDNHKLCLDHTPINEGGNYEA